MKPKGRFLQKGGETKRGWGSAKPTSSCPQSKEGRKVSQRKEHLYPLLLAKIKGTDGTNKGGSPKRGEGSTVTRGPIGSFGERGDLCLAHKAG